jgi:Membrane bound FAD containing D-sorbitol dehydrogenase
LATLGRRAFFAAATYIAAWCSPLGRMAGAAQPQKQSPSLDDFLALSSRLTGRTDLDRAAAAVFLKGLLDTPGNAERLMRPDAALEREIIVSWYTGTYDVRGERRLATHTGALQWRAMGVAVPGACAGRFGAWSQPPRAPAR